MLQADRCWNYGNKLGLMLRNSPSLNLEVETMVLWLYLILMVVVIESREQSERLVLAPRCSRHRLGCDNYHLLFLIHTTTHRFFVPEIPYSTARIINTASFTYRFPVTQGPKFIRLHFYPATYDNLKTEESFFSISSNGYSLLTNFNSSLTTSFLEKTHSS
ncbi:putative non-specific serine/threonine protein kinase [Helianthus anomalus]